MTRQQVLTRARELLSTNHIEDASLEAELLLSHTLNIDRTQLFTESQLTLSPQQEKIYRHYIERRIKGEPSAYITGYREFFGLDFEVDKNVLIPRPETELLVEQAIIHEKKYSKPVIVDVGTGCGAIAICLALNLPDAHIFAIDISPAALKVAKRNCQKHHVENKITLLTGDLLEPFNTSADMIIANLPYVRTGDLPQVNTTGYEPWLALDGGADGLDRIKRLSLQAKEKLLPHGCLLMEIGLGQDKSIAQFLHNLLPSAKIDFTLDLSGIKRVVCAT